MIDGDRGLPVNVGINLYKTLVRTHLEYAIPVWASVAEKDLVKLENVQLQCLKRIIGAKAHSSSSAVEVIAGVLPFRFRKRELCLREYLRIKCKNENHLLVELLNSSMRTGMRFCPFEYLKVMSKELERAISGYRVQKRITLSVTEFLSDDRICRAILTGTGEKVEKANSNSDTTLKYVETVDRFVKQQKGSSVLIFCDGSVCSGVVGSGACAAVLYPLLDSQQTIISTKAVGKKVSSQQCEIEGIILGIEMAVNYFNTFQACTENVRIFVFCDSEYAIDAVDRNLESVRYLEISLTG